MDYRGFYRKLFAPIEAAVGRIDPETIHAIIGFDAGGPLDFCTIGAHQGGRFITYVSCELAVRAEQKPSTCGRYELMVSSDDERWVRSIVTRVGRMSLEDRLGHGHTLDIGACVEATDVIQGIVLETFCQAEIDGERYGILRCIGSARDEMQYARKHGSSSLLNKLQLAGVYPNTFNGRQSAI